VMAGVPSLPSIFLGYPSRPELSRETLARAAELIKLDGSLEVVTWEDLKVSGRLIINQITDAIDGSSVSVFDATTLNQNVLFEVGYAVGAERRVWLVRDRSDSGSDKLWREVGLLTNIGYFGYEHSEELAKAFLEERPFEADTTLYQDLIEPTLDPVDEPTVFYVRSLARTEADRELGRRIRRERRNGIRVTVADARESSVESLSWYAYHCYQASAVVVHLMREGRRGAEAHNARCALVAGLAHGMKRPVLMLAEEPFRPPIDYRDLLWVYRSARECRDRASYWLGGELTAAYARAEKQATEKVKRSLSTELAGLRLGEPIAENEADRLPNYFVSTAVYEEVLQPRSSVFVGRKGAGKTANLIKAASELESDRRNLVCVIQPADYDLEGVLRVLAESERRDAKGYLVESLWKYMVISEIAFAALEDAEDRPAGVVPKSPAWDLSKFIEQSEPALHPDFAVRLERAVASVLEEPPVDGDDIESERARISEALHAGLLRDLTKALVPVLAGKDRIAVLIDNLDQAWDLETDLEQMSQLLLGLLTTVRKIGAELSRRSAEDLVVSLGVFIRSDIYFHVIRRAREPDKIPARILSWTDESLLLEVVEERYVAGHRQDTPREELWQRYFDATVRGTPTRDYIASRVLPRPRDVLYLTNAAIESAVRHRRTRVTESDIVEAERLYSHFAFEALLVEGRGEIDRLEEVLFEFAGSDEVVPREDLVANLRRAGLPEPDAQGAIDSLVSLSFLGLEVREESFEFAEDPHERSRVEALARRFAAGEGREPRYRIHPAFQAFLDVVKVPDGQQRLTE
jgi:hypothetical protein